MKWVRSIDDKVAAAAAVIRKSQPTMSCVWLACSAGVASYYLIAVVNDFIGDVPPLFTYVLALIVTQSVTIYFTLYHLVVNRGIPTWNLTREQLTDEITRAKSLQNTLRFCLFVTSVSSILGSWLLSQGNLVWASLGYISSSGLSVIIANYSIDPTKWWFLWRGPIIAVNQPNVAWLAEIYSHRHYRMIAPQTVKFRKVSAAVAFKLVSG